MTSIRDLPWRLYDLYAHDYQGFIPGEPVIHLGATIPMRQPHRLIYSRDLTRQEVPIDIPGDDAPVAVAGWFPYSPLHTVGDDATYHQIDCWTLETGEHHSELLDGSIVAYGPSDVVPGVGAAPASAPTQWGGADDQWVYGVANGPDELRQLYVGRAGTTGERDARFTKSYRFYLGPCPEPMTFFVNAGSVGGFTGGVRYMPANVHVNVYELWGVPDDGIPGPTPPAPPGPSTVITQGVVQRAAVPRGAKFSAL